MEDLLKIKKELYTKCEEFVEKRIKHISEEMATIRESINEETKSSSGDKYETGRAMLQIELENYSGQLTEAKKLREQLSKISGKTINKKIEPGALVFTSAGNYYFAVSIGKVTLNETDFYIVSPSSPLGLMMNDKVVGQTVELNNRQYDIHLVG